MDWDSTRSSVFAGIRECVLDWCAKNAINIQVMEPWINMVHQLVNSKIEELKSRTKSYNVKEVLKEYDVKKHLEELHSKYVIVPMFLLFVKGFTLIF